MNKYDFVVIVAIYFNFPSKHEMKKRNHFQAWVIFDFIASLGSNAHSPLPFIPCGLVIGGRLSSWQKIGLNETGTECTFVKSTGKNYRMNGWILCARHPSRVGRGTRDSADEERKAVGSYLVTSRPFAYGNLNLYDFRQSSISSSSSYVNLHTVQGKWGKSYSTVLFISINFTSFTWTPFVWTKF